jgi:hypothetical protein
MSAKGKHGLGAGCLTIATIASTTAKLPGTSTNYSCPAWAASFPRVETVDTAVFQITFGYSQSGRFRPGVSSCTCFGGSGAGALVSKE